METEKLIRFLRQLDFSPFKIKDILVHEGYPPEKWGLLCCLVVNDNKKYCHQIEIILQLRIFLLEKRFPAVTENNCGIDFWIAFILINLVYKSYTGKEIAEILKENGFDFFSSAVALSRFYKIIAWPPNILMLTENGGELTDVICWPI